MTVKQLPASGRFYFPNKPTCLVGAGKLAEFASIPSAGEDLNTMLRALERLHMPFSFRVLPGIITAGKTYHLNSFKSSNPDQTTGWFDGVYYFASGEYEFRYWEEVGSSGNFIGATIYGEARHLSAECVFTLDADVICSSNLDTCWFGINGVQQALANMSINGLAATEIVETFNGSYHEGYDHTETALEGVEAKVAMMGVAAESDGLHYTPLYGGSALLNENYREFDITGLVKSYLSSGRGFEGVVITPVVNGYSFGTSGYGGPEFMKSLFDSCYQNTIDPDAVEPNVFGTVKALSVSWDSFTLGEGVLIPDYSQITILANARPGIYPPAGWR